MKNAIENGINLDVRNERGGVKLPTMLLWNIATHPAVLDRHIKGNQMDLRNF